MHRFLENTVQRTVSKNPLLGITRGHESDPTGCKECFKMSVVQPRNSV